jgi:hypothetical protein
MDPKSGSRMTFYEALPGPLQDVFPMGDKEYPLKAALLKIKGGKIRFPCSRGGDHGQFADPFVSHSAYIFKRFPLGGVRQNPGLNPCVPGRRLLEYPLCGTLPSR